MGPETLALIVAGVEAAIKAAPQIVEVAREAKQFITSLFNHGVISAEQQNAIHSHVDAICAAAQAGTVPPSWQVEADPS